MADAKILIDSKKFFSPTIIFVLFITLLSFLTYFPVLFNDFIMWDDDRMIYNNPDLNGLSMKNILHMFTHPSMTRQYSPLATLTYNATYQLSGLNPFGYHLSSLLFHVTNSALLFLFLYKLLCLFLKQTEGFSEIQKYILWSATAGALAWALHPLRVETVAWAGAIFYPQSLFFLLLAMLFYLGTKQPKINGGYQSLLKMTSVIFYALSVLSHPIGICAASVFFILDLLFFQEFPSQPYRSNWTKARQILARNLPFLIVWIIGIALGGLARMNSKIATDPVPSFADFGLWERLMQAMYVIAYYFWRPWFPFNLSPTYSTLVEFNPLSLPFIASAIAVVSILVMLFTFRQKLPGVIPLSFLCYFLILLPVLGFTEHPHYTSDRYSMIPSILWSVLLASVLISLRFKKKIFHAALFLCLVITILLGVLSHQQTKIWKNTPTLFNHMLYVLRDDPYRQDIYRRFGDYYLYKENFPSAEVYFNLALKQDPSNKTLQQFLYYIYYRESKFLAAINGFQEVGFQYLNEGEKPKALKSFQMALDIAQWSHQDQTIINRIKQNINTINNPP